MATAALPQDFPFYCEGCDTVFPSSEACRLHVTFFGCGPFVAPISLSQDEINAEVAAALVELALSISHDLPAPPGPDPLAPSPLHLPQGRAICASSSKRCPVVPSPPHVDFKEGGKRFYMKTKKGRKHVKAPVSDFLKLLKDPCVIPSVELGRETFKRQFFIWFDEQSDVFKRRWATAEVIVQMPDYMRHYVRERRVHRMQKVNKKD